MTHNFRAIAVAGVLIAHLPALAELPEVSLIENLATGPETFGGSGPEGFVRVGDWTLFGASSRPDGRNLWRTDGTPGGTTMVRDLAPLSGLSAETVGPVFVGSKDARVLFVAGDGTGDAALWVSDGSTLGTQRISKVSVTGDPSFPIGRYDGTSGRYFFPGFDEAAAWEVWVSDGTEAGTERLGDHFENVSTLFLDSFVALPGGAFFRASRPSGARELWATDGTAAGTHLVRSFEPDLAVYPEATYGGRLVFAASTEATGVALWASDLASGQARMIWDPVPGAAGGADAVSLLAPGATSAGLVFAAWIGARRELWRTDGTAAGTFQLRSAVEASDLSTNDFSAGAVASLRVEGRLLFTAASAGGASSLWVSDGTIAGTHSIPLPLCPGGAACRELVRLLASRSDLAFLAVADPEHGLELWVSDGTNAGTRLVVDACPGPCSARPFPNFLVGDRLVSALIDASGGFQVWISDGTAAGTRALTAEPGGVSLGGAGTAPNGRLLLSLAARGSGAELWSSDGTLAGTGPLAAIGRVPDPSTSFVEAHPVGETLLVATSTEFPGRSRLWRLEAQPEALVPVTGPDLRLNHRVVFDSGFLWVQSTELIERELWISDGTPAGTRRIEGVRATDLCALISAGSRAFFLKGSPGAPLDLWLTDGTASGTRIVAPGVAGQDCSHALMAPLGDQLIFFGWDGNLWRSDGTTAGTRMIGNLGLVGTQFRSTRFQSHNGRVYFFLARNVQEFWVTDGTTTGTALIKQVAWLPGLEVSPEAVSARGQVFFFAQDAGIGPGLWVTSGTAETTRLVAELPVDSLNSDALFLGGTSEHVFLNLDDGVHGAEPWVSDGTAAGTRMLVDLAPGRVSSNPLALAAIGDRAVFAASDGVSGMELWQTDGTAAGTRQLTDLFPGTRSAQPIPLAVRGDRLYFTADDGNVGNEIFALTLPPAVESCTPPQDLCLHGGRVRVQVTFRDPRTNLVSSATAVPFADRTGLFWFFNPENIELVVKVLDGASTNAHWWSFYGALSDVEYWVEVTDLQSGLSKTYHNPRRNICGVGDTLSVPKRTAGSTAEDWLFDAPPASHQSRGTCAPDGDTLCLLGGRFALEVDWRNHRTGETGRGGTIPGTAQTGYFWFFNAANIELVVKLLDGRGVNGKFWVFYGALSDVEYTLRVTDATTGAMRIYQNPAGEICGRADVEAF